MLPLIIISKLEEWLLSKDTDVVFQFCGQAIALIPGLPGVFFRRAFYSLTIESCSRHCHIGFGSYFSHRSVTVEKHVYIGSYSIIGTAHLSEHCLIGSRASILSGKELHVLGEDGLWTPYSAERATKIRLERNVWVGEGAIIIADVGEGSMIGAGSVVTTKTKAHILVAGNPARFVNKLTETD
jgi:acetyltransferase-like isoleucine patch superfamily enzyme